MFLSPSSIITKLFRSIRGLSTKSNVFKEVNIPVPWGHIAGKWWGPQNIRPILCCHGWQDNCASFDTLIPLLPDNLGYLAIDWPGHGHSSYLPPGMFYHGMNSVILIKLIANYYNWPKVALLAHSLGGIICYKYGFLFPDEVDYLICLDTFKPIVPDSKKLERVVKGIEDFLKYDRLNGSKREPPSYEYNVLQKLLHEGTRGSIDLDKCKILLERNILPSRKKEGKYYFKRDPRLKVNALVRWAQNDLVESAKRITMPIFLSRVNQSPFFDDKGKTAEVIDVIRKVNRDFEFHPIEGTHHVHLNHPERLAGLISAFIKKHDGTIR